MQKKLNTLTLSGLMIGPILGSGIVLLPPIAISILGDRAIFAWIIIMSLGIIFAYVFAKMSLQISSNEGMSTVIGQSLGQFFRELASNYLTAAVCFGPVAVLLTASEFIRHIFDIPNVYKTGLAFIILVLCVIVLLRGVTTVGKLTLVLSSLTAILLVAGSVYSLLTQDAIFYPTQMPEIGKLGYTLLLLFWAIIGWEVIGNYVEEVENPEQTIMRAMKISVGAITIVYLISAFALQNRMQLQGIESNTSMSLILVPMFGDLAYILMGAIAAGLCFCTLLMILGAVTRQIAVRAENGILPSFLKMRQKEKVPKNALLFLTGWHCILLILIHYNILAIEGIVGIANTFFIGNALLGLAASIRYMKSYWIKGCILILMISLTILLAFSSVFAWIAMIVITALSIYKNKNRTVKDSGEKTIDCA